MSVTPNPDTASVQKVAQNPADSYDEFLCDTRYLLLDRDNKFLPPRRVLDSKRPRPLLTIPSHGRRDTYRANRLRFTASYGKLTPPGETEDGNPGEEPAKG